MSRFVHGIVSKRGLSSVVDVMMILGQSNAGGWAVDPANRSYTTDSLVKSWDGSAWQTYIPASRWDIWEPGSFTGISENAPYGNWAAELRYAQLYRAANPGKELRIFKMSYGGSTMYENAGWADWNPNSVGDQFDLFDTFATNGLAAILAEGKTYSIRFVFVMQGEHDAYGGVTTANAYATNIAAFIAAARTRWPILATTPFVLGRLAPALIDVFRTVRGKQVDVAIADDFVSWINTDDCAWQEPHYDAVGYIKMGETLYSWDTIRPADVAASDYPVLWNQAARGPNSSVSSDGLTASCSAASGTEIVFATKPLTDKRMWQVKFTAGAVSGSGITAFGIGDISDDFAFGAANYPGHQKNLAVHFDGGYHVFNDTPEAGADNFGYANTVYTNNDFLSVCVDPVAKLVWSAVNNGNWNNDAAANPATGTGGKSFNGMVGPVAPCVVLVNGASAVLNAGATAFSRTIPSGFLALGDAGASPTLNNLTLSASSITSGSAAGTLVGTIQNRTAGSTLTLTDTAGSRFAISSSSLVAGATATNYATATSHNVTIRETLTGATNTPHDTTLTVTVVDATTSVLDASNKGTDVVLSSGNTVASRSGGTGDIQLAFATKSLTGKKVMAEFTLTAIGTKATLGVGNNSLGLTASDPDYAGHHKNLAVLWDSGYYSYNDAGDAGAASFGAFFGAAPVAGNKIAIVVDEPNRLLWMAIGTGDWNFDATANPATGAGGKSISGMAVTLKFVAGLGVGSNVTLNDGTTTFTKTLPSGVTALKDA